MQVESLVSAAATQGYYDARYARGYMDRWEAERFARLREVLRDVQLPTGARILDFGCGSGALTTLLAERWPDATVHGADISAVAVAAARQRDPTGRIAFAALDERFVRENAGTFDFVWSHHVLEHVFDLTATVRDLCSLLAPGGRMLHVLPCGNPGSLPHWLCLLRPDGIDPAMGNRFFFEEASHVRRLCSDELARHFAVHGCTVAQAAFGYHWLGAVRLFTETAPGEVLALLHPLRCHARSLPLLLPLLAVFLALTVARAPYQVLVRARRLLQQVFLFRTRRLGEPASVCLLLLTLPALCLWPLSALVEAAVRWGDRREWRARRRDARGSEMLMEFAAAPRG